MVALVTSGHCSGLVALSLQCSSYWFIPVWMRDLVQYVYSIKTTLMMRGLLIRYI
ncbi:hypothetical protein SRHO_G00110400 [Serrasalmus rhombeus]